MEPLRALRAIKVTIYWMSKLVYIPDTLLADPLLHWV